MKLIDILTENIKDQCRETIAAFHAAIVKVQDPVKQKNLRTEFDQAKDQFLTIANKTDQKSTQQMNDALYNMKEIITNCK